jgi:hypothetical protein
VRRELDNLLTWATGNGVLVQISIRTTRGDTMCLKPNIKVRLGSCFCWKAITVKYSEYVFVHFVIQQEKRMRRIIFSPVLYHSYRINYIISYTERLRVKEQVPRNRPEGPEGGRCIALLLLDLGARRGGWSAPRPGRFTPGKDSVSTVQKAGWAPGPVWTCAKNLAPTGIRSPDRPACSQSL